jgi:hypothetical protein
MATEVLNLSRMMLVCAALALRSLLILSFLVLCSLLLLLSPDPVCAQFDPDEIERVYQSKDYAKVEAIAQARLQIDPYDVRARYYLASVLLNQKRGGQALLQYEACVKCGGNSTLAQLARKAVLALKNDAKRANPLYFERAKIQPKGSLSSGGATTAAGTKIGSGVAGTSEPADADDPVNREAIASLRKDLADAIEVKRRRQSQDLELVAEEENQAVLEAAATLSVQRDQMIEAVRAESAAKRDKVYRLYKEEEDSITKAYQLRIDALRRSYKRMP